MTNPAKLIVLMAFDRNVEGSLLPAFEPRQCDTEERAKREAQVLADRHSGVIAWSRTASPDIGEYGPPEILFTSGDVPEME
jgi:hypothetical protein